MKLKNLQQVLKFKPPPVSPLHWKERLEQLTGKHPDQCPFCQQKNLILLGNIVHSSPSLRRSPPAILEIITSQGILIPIVM
ncbi:MAG: hypothetical protein AB8F94_01185 [Saprospiraceae bacterium]